MPAVVRDTDCGRRDESWRPSPISDRTAMCSRDSRARPFPSDLSWMLPPSALTRRAVLACDVRANAWCFVRPPPKESESLIEVPKTRPMFSNCGGPAVGRPAPASSLFELGTPVVLPASWRQLELRSLSGETYRIERNATKAGPRGPTNSTAIFSSATRTSTTRRSSRGRGAGSRICTERSRCASDS